jgi:hypothetical protein
LIAGDAARATFREPSGDYPGAHMFEPVSDLEKKRRSRTLKIIWIVIVIVAVIPAIVSFA